MLSLYLIVLLSGLAAAALSFLTWIILLLSFGNAVITTTVIAAIGLSYFLLHILLLSLLRFNLRSFSQSLLHADSSNPSINAASLSPGLRIARTIAGILKHSPVLRRVAWGLLAAAAVFLLISAKDRPSCSPKTP
ncbi:MAG: hypothetical protein FGM18_01095 [Burkholderiaceae bacterium]|nr:hypothetical protein [Burkholderiaceae bacterium]